MLSERRGGDAQADGLTYEAPVPFHLPSGLRFLRAGGLPIRLPVTVAAGTLIRFRMQSVFNKGVYSFEFFGLTGISEEINF